MRASVVAFFVFTGSWLFAQQHDSVPDSTQRKGFIHRMFFDTTSHSGLFAIPLLYYTPDTRWAYGAMGVYYFHVGGPSARLSYAKLLIDYTQNKQLDVWSSWNIFLKEERWLIKGEARYRNFPDRFYGIGNQTTPEMVERYTYDLLSMKILGLKRIRKGMFAGADYQVLYMYKMKVAEGGILDTAGITGVGGGLNSGFGLVFVSDQRDNVVNARTGYFFEVSSYYYRPAFGSDFNYTTLNMTFNKYIPVYKSNVVAFNSVVNLNFGNPTFITMSQAGGDDILRGYAKNRFRDHNFVGAQTEYRFKIWKRFGGTVFAGVGDVFRDLKDVSWNTMKYSYGAGLRYMVNRKERLNIRLDYGIGRGNSSFYIMITEAF